MNGVATSKRERKHDVILIIPYRLDSSGMPVLFLIRSSIGMTISDCFPEAKALQMHV